LSSLLESRLVANVEIQLIEKFSATLKQLLTAWSAANGSRLPNYVLLFRSGVSDSQYIQAQGEEVNKIKEAFEEFRLGAQFS
jgi:Piwi domain